MMKLVNGKPVRLTAGEQAAIEAEWGSNAQEATARRTSMGYREARKAAYVAGLGMEGDATNTIGDVLDVVIKKVRAIDAGRAEPEFDDLVSEIDRIKRENPKP